MWDIKIIGMSSTAQNTEGGFNFIEVYARRVHLEMDVAGFFLAKMLKIIYD